MVEIWKAVSGFPELGHVEVSNLGRVRTLDRLAQSRREHQPTQLRKGQILSPWLAKNGYYHVRIAAGSVRKKYLVHRLVAKTFVAGYFDGASVDHLDGDKTKNHADNLQWVSLAENTRRQWAMGLVNLRGELHPRAKLLDAQVRQIAELLGAGEKVSALSIRFGVSRALIYKIGSGSKKAWLLGDVA